MSHQALQQVQREVREGNVSERPHGNLCIYKYTAQCVNERAWNDVNSKCRGIVFDTTTGTIIARSFDKFFNLGERPSTEIKFVLKKAKEMKFQTTEKMDGCFDKDSMVMFCDGTSHRMKDIVEQKMQGPIWGVEHTTGKVVPTDIIAWHNNGMKNEWLTIHVKSIGSKGNKRSLRCTPNHHFFTDGGYKEARTLKVGEVVYQIGYQLDRVQRSMILGSLLGDLSLSKQTWTPIEWCHSVDQQQLSELKIKLLSPLHASTYTIKGGSGKNWAKKDVEQHVVCGGGLFKEFDTLCFKDGKKTITREWLDQLDNVALALWYMDDGSMSRGNPGQRPRVLFSTECYTKKEQEIIVNYFNETYGFDAKIQEYKEKYYCIRLNADDAEKFWSLIAPYIVQDLQYKLPEHHRMSKTFWDDYAFPQLQLGLTATKIKDIKRYNARRSEKEQNTASYDLTTTTHNYFVSEVLVHNSMISVWHYNNRWQCSTPGSITSPQALYATETLLPKYDLSMIPEDITLICELIAPMDREDKVIVYGDRDELVLLTAFENKWEQTEIPFGRVQYFSKITGISLVPVWNADYENFLSLDIPENKEGYVIAFEDSHRIKIKSMAYLKAFRLVSEFSRKHLLDYIETGEYHDAVKILPDLKRQHFDDIYAQVMTTKGEIELEAELWYHKCDPADMKKSAQILDTVGPVKGLVFMLLREKTQEQMKKLLWKLVREKFEG